MISKKESKPKLQETKQTHTETQNQQQQSGSRTYQEVDNASRINYHQLVADAEAAGFNPLTALRLGGGAGYTQTSSNSLSDTIGYSNTNTGIKSETIGSAMVPGTPIIGPALSQAGQIIGNAVSDYDPMKRALQEAEYDLAQAQIRNLNSDSAARNGVSVGGVPSWTGSNIARNPGTGALSGGYSSGADGGAMRPTYEAPTITNPWASSLGWKVNPGVPDTEMFATRYGDSEIAQMLFGAGVGISDFRYNYYDPSKQSPLSGTLKSIQNSLPSIPMPWSIQW